MDTLKLLGHTILAVLLLTIVSMNLLRYPLTLKTTPLVSSIDEAAPRLADPPWAESIREAPPVFADNYVTRESQVQETARSLTNIQNHRKTSKQKQTPSPTSIQSTQKLNITTKRPFSTNISTNNKSSTKNALAQKLPNERQNPTTYTSSHKKKKDFEQYLKSKWSCSQICVRPTNDSTDLPKHKPADPRFSCDKTIRDSVDDETVRNPRRRQIHISCDGDISSSYQRLVKFTEDIQSFNTADEKACLHRYIRQHCYDGRPVPDVVHLLWYGAAELSFRNGIGLYSIFSVGQPCLVVMHGNVAPTGPMWENILPAATRLVRVYKEPRTNLNGTRIAKVQNQADIGRIEIMIEYGGIYLDSDMVVVRKLDMFRDAQMAAGKAGSAQNLANGVLIARPNHSLMKEWLDMWQTYNGVSWNSHSTLLISRLADQYPGRMSALGPIFIKFGWKDQHQMYREECSLHPSYAAHLYVSQYPYSHKTTSEQLEIIKTVNTTFGRLTRFALFGDSSPCRKRT